MCIVENCMSTSVAKGLCGKHYQRVRLHGTLILTIPNGMSPGDKVDHYGWTVTKTGCWEFNGPKNESGYGTLYWSKSKHLVHRFMYETLVGPIPEGHVVRHKCDNPPCINPDHLETGTQADNARDMYERGRNVSTPLLGERNPSAKLTEHDVLEIRRLSEAGYSLNELAEIYGVCKPHVGLIVRRLRWRHV